MRLKAGMNSTDGGCTTIRNGTLSSAVLSGRMECQKQISCDFSRERCCASAWILWKSISKRRGSSSRRRSSFLRITSEVTRPHQRMADRTRNRTTTLVGVESTGLFAEILIMRAQCKTERFPQGRIGDSAAHRQALFLMSTRQYGSVPPSHNCKPVIARRADGKFSSADD